MVLRLALPLIGHVAEVFRYQCVGKDCIEISLAPVGKDCGACSSIRYPIFEALNTDYDCPGRAARQDSLCLRQATTARYAIGVIHKDKIIGQILLEQGRSHSRAVAGHQPTWLARRAAHTPNGITSTPPR